MATEIPERTATERAVAERTVAEGTATERTVAGASVPDGPPNPEPIMGLAAGFMAAKHLFAASELGLFEVLADAPATLDVIAARTGLTRRTVRISADAMVGLGLLERDGDVYHNAETAAAFLTGATPFDLRPFLRLWDKISYPAWTRLSDALGSGTVAPFELDEEQQEIFSAGVEAVLAGPAAALAERFDFADRHRLLDVGGGTGSWSVAVLDRHPHLAATVLELPAVTPITRSRVAEAGLATRIAVAEGDALAGPLPTGHDTCLVANLIHYFSPEENQRLLRNVRAAVQPGASLLLADFWTDPTHTQPLIAALMAGEFAVHLPHGDVYSVEEGKQWLHATGWEYVDHHPLAGPVSLLSARAA